MTDVHSNIAPITSSRCQYNGIFNSSNWRIRDWFKWRPTSSELLEQAEKKLLKHIKGQYVGISVPVLNRRIWTIKIHKDNHSPQKYPLVMIHGFAGGVGLFAQNLESLSRDRPVYALDLPGFARSCRSHIDSSDAVSAEDEFVNTIEAWRKEMNIDDFILLGHSFGAYLASAYSMRYPDNVKHLILADPWGMNVPPDQKEMEKRFSLRFRVLGSVVQKFNPLAAIRAAGPWGPNLIRKFRSDLKGKFDDYLEEDSGSILDYIYHCNAQNPSGEIAFKSLSHTLAWAKNPMVHRIATIEDTIPMTLIYGSDSWMDIDTGLSFRDIRKNAFVDVQIIDDAGHHVYADKPIEFNDAVNKVAERTDMKARDSGTVLTAQDISRYMETSI